MAGMCEAPVDVCSARKDPSMPPNPSEKKMAEAEALQDQGKTREALRLLKQVVAETDEVELQMDAAAQIVSSLLDELTDFPDPGSPEYLEIHKYLKIFIESYDQVDSETQQAFQEPASVEAFRELLNLTKQGKSMRVPITPIQKKMADAQDLLSAGKPERAIGLLKEVVAEANDVYDRMFAAGIIGSIMTYNRQPPAPGTTEYAELHKYIGIAIDCYDRADSEAQQRFRDVPNDIGAIRNMLRQMEEGQSIGKNQKSGCFIATAAYGSPLAPEVLVFRLFRDRVLLSSKSGTALVEGYYFISPPLARFISKAPFLRAATRRLLLAPILRLLRNRSRF